VAIQMPNSWEYVVVTLALARARAVAVPLSVMLTVEEVRNAVNDAGARLVLASPLKAAGLASLVGSSEASRVVALAEASKGPGPTLDALLGNGRVVLSEDASLEDVASIVYTSATAGKPRGAELTHRAIVQTASMFALAQGRTAEDVTVTALPLPHIYGSMVLHATLLTGGTLVLMKQFSEAETLASIARHRATIADGVPTMYAHLLAYPGLPAADLSSLTHCSVGGAEISHARLLELESRLGVPVLELWGMTELAGAVLCRARATPRREGSVGQVLPGLELRVVDAEDAARVLPQGEVGELSVRGDAVMRGYRGDPVGTAEVKDADGWLRISTIGRVDEAGYVFVLDTKRRVIVTGGYKIYPAEVEQVLRAHPAVAQVVILPARDDLRGEIAHAHVVLEAAAHATEAELLAFCASRLASYKLPGVLTIAAELPPPSRSA
jgi:long-chain acyl-CoA synthetase